MQVGRKIDMNSPDSVFYLRVAYVASQLLQLAVCYFLTLKIKSKNDNTILKYVEPKAPGQQEPAKLATTTNRDYDLSEVSKQVRTTLMGMAMIGFMHLYMGYTQPLFIQSLMPLKSLFDNTEVKIHLRGHPATGDLKRPFKAPGLMGAMGTPETDKAAIAEAEKNSGATG